VPIREIARAEGEEENIGAASGEFVHSKGWTGALAGRVPRAADGGREGEALRFPARP